MRIEQLERTVAPVPKQIHIVRVIVDPQAPGDRITEVIARRDDRTPISLVRKPDETTKQLRERTARVMGWS